MYKEKWKELGYTDEQAEELERLSKIGGDIDKVKSPNVEKMLHETMMKYEKENKSMSNTENLKNDFVKTLKENMENFVGWTNACEEITKATRNFNNGINEIKEVDGVLVGLEKEEVKAVTTFEIDLAKEGIDVSKWEEPVKPVKAILSIMTKDENGEFVLRIGDMAMLMEDGTFRVN